MEKRRSRRKIVSLEAELISGGISYKGFIGNISGDGIYIRTAPTKTTINFAPKTTLELKFQLPSGETLNLHCKVIWSYKTPPHGLTYSMGVKIIDPPPKYKEFLETLQ